MNKKHITQRKEYSEQAIHTSNTIISLIQDLGIDIGLLLMIDHICYRCISDGQYDSMKDLLHQYSQLLDESEIWWRRVSIWKLSESFETVWWAIPCIELSAPKPDNKHLEWREHIEIVVEDLENIYQHYKELITENKWFTKARNRDLEIEFPNSRPWWQLAVKFHEKSIEDILLEEKTPPFNS